MRKSLLYVFAVICTMGFFTACGDDDDSSSSGNWQDLSKTYEGKSVNLVMGEVTIPVDGKSVVIAASSAEKASVTLNNIIPENKSVVIDAALKEADGTYTFTGESTVGDCVVSVNGTVKGGFQIKDDIFDYFKEANIGKPTGNDIREGKVTLPLLYALRQGREEEAARYLDMILRKDFAAENVDSLIEFAKANGGIEYAEARMKEYHDKAVDVLLRLPESEARTSLIQLADYIMTRSK